MLGSPLQSDPQSDATLRTAVAAIDQRRRARAARGRVAELAPYAAGLGLILALASRWFGWTAGVPAVALVLLAAVLAAMAWWGSRALPVSDAAAASIDHDAQFGGELHSAHWFAGRPLPEADAPVGTSWAAFHLSKAAARIQAQDWAALYPPVQASRQWLTSGALVAVAIIALVVGPRSREAILASQGLTPEEIEAAMAGELLPDDIQARIDALLGEITEGGLTDESARLKMDELRDLLGKLSEAEKEAALAKGEAAEAQGGEKPSDDPGDALAAKAEEAADASAGLPEDVRWSLEDLANRLANAKPNQTEANKDNPSASEQTGEKGNAGEGAEAAQMQQAAGMQMVREAASDAAEGQMMQGGGGAMGGDSKPGAGGNQGGQGQIDMQALAQALRQEMIQAQTDQLGENIDTELRRKTEQSQAKVGFTRVPAPTTFDRSRAALPPPVPEAHRSLLQRYFQRRQ
jgi:hypothetical protein